MFLNRENKRTPFVVLNTKNCKGCWKCIENCSNSVINKIDLPWHKHALIVNPDACNGCLYCIKICSSGAYKLAHEKAQHNFIGDKSEIKLGSVQKTLLLPLWGRAIETQKQKPLLIDTKAVSIINSIPYDFSVISNNINELIQYGWIARSIFFDKKIKAFIEVHPEATIVNIGCGLDTTFDRVDNGKIQWIDLDLPDTIDLRKKYIPESDRRHFIAKSAMDKSWYSKIEHKSSVMLLIAGVLHYFEEKEVKGLFNDFHTFLPGAEVIFDYASIKGMKLSNKQVIEKGGMDESAHIKWGIRDILEIEKWNSNIKIISNMPLYKEHKKHYGFPQKIGMNIADLFKIMSLAHIKIS